MRTPEPPFADQDGPLAWLTHRNLEISKTARGERLPLSFSNQFIESFALDGETTQPSASGPSFGQDLERGYDRLPHSWSGAMKKTVGASKRKFRIKRKFRLRSSGFVTC
jgi:hypothetical protein